MNIDRIVWNQADHCLITLHRSASAVHNQWRTNPTPDPSTNHAAGPLSQTEGFHFQWPPAAKLLIRFVRTIQHLVTENQVVSLAHYISFPRDTVSCALCPSPRVHSRNCLCLRVYASVTLLSGKDGASGTLLSRLSIKKLTAWIGEALKFCIRVHTFSPHR